MNPLVVRVPNWLGDSVMARPVVAALQKQAGSAGLTVVAHARVADLWNPWPGLEVITYSPTGSNWRAAMHLVRTLRHLGPFRRGYLLSPSLSSALLFAAAGISDRIGFSTDGRGWLLTHPVSRHPIRGQVHLSREFLRLIDGTDDRGTAPPPYAWPETSRQAVAARLAAAGLQAAEFIVVAVGAAGAIKRYPIGLWRQSLVALASRYPVILVGTASERPLAAEMRQSLEKRVIDWCGETDLSQLGVLLERARGFVGVDSGAAHLAAGVGCPTVALFGPGDPAETGPRGPQVAVVQPSLWCAPCRSRNCFRRDHPSECMDRIHPGDVVRALEGLLAQSRPAAGHAGRA